jgi:hypothetical protein
MSAMKKAIMMMMMVTMIMMMVVTSFADDGTNPVPPCNKCLGAGQACGDPHMLGFDGKAFDIWKAGDYLVLKESDGFEISFTVRNRWGEKSSPWITEIRCTGPGGPWMKVTAATATRNSPDDDVNNGPIEATVFVDGVGTVDNGDSYTDPTTSLRVQKSVQGSSIAFVAPRWTLTVDHKIAHVRKDGWHYLNMAITITSLLETPVTGVLGVTYNPDTYAQILQHGLNKASHSVVDHSSSSRSLLLKSAKPHAVLVYEPADEDEFLQSIPTVPGRKLMALNKCCGTTAYDSSTNVCCKGQMNNMPAGGPPVACCGYQAYSQTTHKCCPYGGGVVWPIHQGCPL